MQDNWDNPSTDTERTNDFIGETIGILSFRALHDNDPLTRKHAVYMLGQAKEPESIDTCIKALRDPEKAVRGQAVWALAEIGEPSSERLISLLNDPDWKVRYRAAETLGMMKEKRAVSPLIGLLSDKNDHVRYMAVKSLGGIGAMEARESIKVCQQDKNPYVRRMSETALSIIGKKGNPLL